MHHVFFDDNILWDEAHIVDTWDVESKQRVSFKESNNVFLSKVHFVQAVCEQDYFIKSLIQCLRTRAKQVGMTVHPAFEEEIDME